MRRPGPAALLLIALGVAGCTSSGNPAATSTSGPAVATTGASSSAPTTSQSGTGQSGMFTLRVRDLTLFNSEESDNGFRVLFTSPATPVTVTLQGAIPVPNRVIEVCAVTTLDTPSRASCSMPSAGQAVRVVLPPGAQGVEINQVGVSASGAAGNRAQLAEVTIAWTGPSRAVEAQLPPVEAGGGPSFAITPPTGSQRAKATWTRGTSARLTVESASRVVATADGGPGLEIATQTGPPAEALVRLRNTGDAPLIRTRLSLS